MNRRMMNAVISTYSSSFCASPGSIAKPNELVANHLSCAYSLPGQIRLQASLINGDTG
jgi:hypothetical protein